MTKEELINVLLHDPLRFERMMMMTQNHITKEFYAFLLVIKAQYLLLFSKLYGEKSTQQHIITITQGYDYAIPSFKRCFSFRYPLKTLLNFIMDNGCWLKRPLKIRGIFEETLQKALVLTFIYEFNRAFIDIATSNKFDKVYHVDCRNLAFDKKCWHDELHYKRHVYKVVARAYSHIIDNHGNCEKVVRAADFREKILPSKEDNQTYFQNQRSPMYYLVIKNLNNEKCIDKNKDDVYASGGNYSCLKTMTFNKTNFVRKIQIRCIENPSETITASVYSD